MRSCLSKNVVALSKGQLNFICVPPLSPSACPHNLPPYSCCVVIPLLLRLLSIQQWGPLLKGQPFVSPACVPPPTYRHLTFLSFVGILMLDPLSPGADTAVAINRHRCMCGADASGIGGSGMWDSVERLEQEREVRTTNAIVSRETVFFVRYQSTPIPPILSLIHI